MTRLLWVFALVLPLAGRLGAQNCPPVSFLNIAEAVMGTLNPSLRGTLLLRQADGSFLGQNFQGRPPNSTNTGATPNFERNLLNCSAASGRTAQPVPGRPNLRDDLLGAAARNPLVTDLTGDGSVTGLGVTPYANAQNLLHSLVVNAAGAQTLATHAIGATGPRSIVTADFNGDGRRDAALLNASLTGSGSVSIFLGTGTAGLFQAAVNYPVGRIPTTMIAYDFNGDTRPEIVTVNGQDATITVLVNNGDGTFRAGATFSPPGFPQSVVAADATGDGRADLIVGGDGISVFAANADGSFRPPIRTEANWNANSLAAGDFNKDGRIDLAAGEEQGYQVMVLYGNGNGRFTPGPQYLLGSPENNSEIHLFALDFDGDTHLDIVVGGGHPDVLTPPPYSASVKVLFNRGDGTFLGAPSYRAGTNTPASLVTGDFNGDGKLDAAVNSNRGVALFLGTGAGFQNAIFVPVRDGNLTTGTLAVAAADFNGDGALDLAVSASASSNVGIFTMLGNGNGSFRPAVKAGAINETPGLAAGDLNGDGKVDLVAGQRSSQAPLNQVRIFLGNGDGTFQAPTQFPVGSNPGKVRLTDLNGDGRLDLIAICEGTFASTTDLGGVAVALGNGAGGFQAAGLLAAGANPFDTAAGDVNGDGRPDLMTSAGDGGLGSYKVFLHLNQGNGAFGAPVQLNTDFGPSGIAIADFDGDGKNDAIVGHCCGETDAGLYLGNGNGTFQAERLLGVGMSSLVAVGDLNADGKPDLIIASRDIALLFNLAGPVPGAACTFSLSRPSGVAGALGDALGVVVKSSSPSCGWTASSSEPWIGVSTGQRQGPGAVLLNVAANTANAARTGVAIIAGLPFTVTQAAQGCAFTLSPQSLILGAGFGSADLTVTTGAACQWTPQTGSDWLTTSDTGPGSRTASLFANSNAGPVPRASTVYVGGVAAQVIQSATAPLDIFTDVPTADPFYNHIALLRDRAVTSGCTPTSYCPAATTTRGQMAVFIIRALLGSEDFPFPAAPFFTDVPATHPYFRYVQKMRELGITAGCTATAYCADDPVTRGQMAVFIIRAASGLAPQDVFAFPAGAFFTDAPVSHPFFPYIQLMRQRGITTGCTATTYCPGDPVTRGQMAVFIVRGLLAQ